MSEVRPPTPDLSAVHHVHMIAVCGTGMGSLAGMLLSKGLKVTGSDQSVYPPMSTQLRDQGVEIREGYRPENLADKPDLVVVGNAVSRDNAEVQEMLGLGIPYVSFPEALEKFFLHGRTPVVVSGTHGKTTTTSMCAWVLEKGGLHPGFMIGGVARNFGRNDRIGTGDPFVVEGDEYDSAFFDKEPKFLHYRPHIGVLTSVEFDHGDIYPDLDTLKAKFRRFMTLPPHDGLLIVCSDYPAILEMLPDASCPVVTYGVGKEAQWRASDITRADDGGTRFKLEHQDREIHIPMTGKHNVLNAVSAAIVADRLGLGHEVVQAGLNSFTGIARRQELIGEAAGVKVYDDFAHHPTAIRETVEAIRMRHPDSRLIAVFEPRSNTSRRNIFQDEFPAAFGHADIAIIAPVFKAEKIEQHERLNVERLLHDIRAEGVHAESPGGVNEIVANLVEKSEAGDVVLIMSNGGFDGIHGKLLAALEQKAEE